MEKVGITIIGAGVVGLSVANELSSKDKSMMIIERNEAFGMESSSRNSEVIHAGIYYPTGSLKQLLCVEGNRLLYEICETAGIGCKKTGKLIVATEPEYIGDLHELYENGKENAVPGLELISSDQARDYEAGITCVEAILSTSTGIIDSHGLMKYFLGRAKSNGANIIFNTEIKQISKCKENEYIITVQENNGSEFEFKSELVVNCAGLNSDTVAKMAGIDVDKAGYRLNYCKGSYFKIHDSRKFNINHLVYPVVHKDSISLGVHIDIDLMGELKLGPDVEYLDDRIQDYSIPENKKHMFYESVRKFFPAITPDILYPDTSGIRAKLRGPEDDFKDFVIKDEKDKGLGGFIDLVGIDSPGLTSSAAIGRKVKKIIYG